MTDLQKEVGEAAPMNPHRPDPESTPDEQDLGRTNYEQGMSIINAEAERRGCTPAFLLWELLEDAKEKISKQERALDGSVQQYTETLAWDRAYNRGWREAILQCANRMQHGVNEASKIQAGGTFYAGVLQGHKNALAIVLALGAAALLEKP